MNLDAASVKEHADIAQVVGQFVKLQKAGPHELVGSCPFHKEQTPSFTVTPGKHTFYCFGCQAGGDVFSFIQRIEGLPSFGDAVKRVAEISGMDTTSTEASAPHAESVRHDKPIQSKVTATYPYVDEQGELLYEVQRIEPGRSGKAKDFRQRRPHPVDGAWVWGITSGAYRKRDSGGDWFPVKGESAEGDDELPDVRRVLYHLPDVLAAREVWIVEGEKDALTMERFGFIATTNSGGAAQKWLPEYSEALRGRRVVVIPDNDEPGQKKAAVIVKALAGIAADALLLTLPGTVKDVTEWAEGGGTREQLEVMASDARRAAKAEEIEARGLLTPTEIIELCDGGVNSFLDPSKRTPGLKTGYARLDEMTLGMHGGELIILAARPAMGKTALALNIGANVASGGNPVAIFSLEMSREQLLTRAMCSRGRINQLKFRSGNLDADERRRAQRALSELAEMPLLIDDRPSTNLKTIRRKLGTMLARVGLKLVILDYLQLMTSETKENRTQEVSALSRGLKLLAREFSVPFLVLSQLSRAPEQRQGNHRPQLSDLRESGGIEQDADVVSFIFREEVYKPDREDLRGLAEIIIAKQRNGPIGTVRLAFLNTITRFENLAAS
jgi:replicative DNA helicase